MTAGLWWYIISGIILGFCLSTVWEWLYFRQRRMRIRDHRIAELEQKLDAQARTIAAVEVLPEPSVTWTAAEYQSPGVLLENETDLEANAGGQPDAGMSTGEKALLGAAAVGTATVVAHALADDHEDAPPPPTAEDTSEENATGELAAATVVGAAAAALMAEDQAADDAAPAPAMDADTDENADAAAVAAVTAHDTDEDSHELADAGGAVDTKPSANQPQPPVTEEVHGVVARPGYIVSELSPGEFAALQTTQKARAAARKAWEQARAVTDYLRNV